MAVITANFIKKQAFALTNEGGSDKFLLGDEQKNTIMTFYKDRSYAAAYGSGLPVSSIAQGSVTYLLNSGTLTSTDKTAIGAGTGNGNITTTANGKFKQKTVYLSKSKKIEDGFFESDLMQGMEQAVAVKYAQALDTFAKEYERGFLHTVVNSVAAGDVIALDPSAITSADLAKAAKDKIVDAAFDLAEIENVEYALDGFEESRIFIDLSSKLFNRLVDERLIENEADATFKEGIFRVGQMGGFRVRRNEFLGKPQTRHDNGSTGTTGTQGLVHAIIATDVTAAGPRKLVAANAGQIGDLSADEGYYIEQKFASKDGSSVDYAVMGVAPLIKVFATALS